MFLGAAGVLVRSARDAAGAAASLHRPASIDASVDTRDAAPSLQADAGLVTLATAPAQAAQADQTPEPPVPAPAASTPQQPAASTAASVSLHPPASPAASTSLHPPASTPSASTSLQDHTATPAKARCRACRLGARRRRRGQCRALPARAGRRHRAGREGLPPGRRRRLIFVNRAKLCATLPPAIKAGSSRHNYKRCANDGCARPYISPLA